MSPTPAKPTPEQLERLTRECEVKAYRSPGPGGQKKNKTESSIRARHLPTGIVRVATEHRSQYRNRALALERVWEELRRRARKAKPRVATRPGKAAVERRLAEKRRESARKRTRQAADDD
jgi:protein subunit release factor B